MASAAQRTARTAGDEDRQRLGGAERRALRQLGAGGEPQREVAAGAVTGGDDAGVAVGDVRVRIVRPRDAAPVLPVVLYMHGGGWILGNAGTHDRLVRELAVGARAAVAFVEYTPSPEARYPVAIEQGYATAQWLTREGAAHGLDPTRMAVAGESVGGNMTAALALMAEERGDVTFRWVKGHSGHPMNDLVDQLAVEASHRG